jgi:hypothetical protein
LLSPRKLFASYTRRVADPNAFRVLSGLDHTHTECHMHAGGRNHLRMCNATVERLASDISECGPKLSSWRTKCQNLAGHPAVVSQLVSRPTAELFLLTSFAYSRKIGCKARSIFHCIAHVSPESVKFTPILYELEM